MKDCLLGAAVVALVATGCGGGPAPTAAPGGGGESAFQRVLDRIGPDGTIDETTALQAFAVAFGPLPGVPRPQGSAVELRSGTGPLRWVMALLGQLTPAQRAAVLAVVPKPAGATAAADGGTTLLASGDQARLTGLVEEAWGYWSAKYPPATLVHPITHRTVTVNSQQKEGATTDAYTNVSEPLGPHVVAPSSCDFYFNPLLLPKSAAYQRETVYHEMFHCFQAQMVPDLADFERLRGSWLIEGGAEWAGDQAIQAGPDSWWKTYFDSPSMPLFRRSYDALGAFAHLAEAGADVIGRFPAAMNAAVGSGADAAAFAAFTGGSQDHFFASWPTGLLRKPGLGADWDARGPDITGDAVHPDRIAAGNSGPAIDAAAVPAYTNADHLLTVSADVLAVDGGTYSRMRALGGTFDASGLNAIYCTLGQPCTCPSGSPLAGIEFKHLDRGSYYVALSGGPSGSAYSQQSFGLAQFCQQGATDSCLYGRWTLSAPPNVALPANVSLQKLVETLDIAQDGVITLTVDIIDSIDVSGGPSARGELTGPATIRVLAVDGVIEPKGSDFTGWSATVDVGGFVVTVPVAEVAGDIGASLTPVSYRCSGRTLLLTGQTGTQWTFVKA